MNKILSVFLIGFCFTFAACDSSKDSKKDTVKDEGKSADEKAADAEEKPIFKGTYVVTKKLPKGLNSQIGESGSFLSGGQKQKIILARNLYKHSDIIVIDEGTSALDNTSEKIIMNHFINKIEDKTIIIVSHRINLLKQVSLILPIKCGIIILM